MNAAEELLGRLGVGLNYKGCKRVTFILERTHTNEELLYNMTALYREITLIYGCTWYAVERSIRTVIQCAWARNPKLLMEIAGYPLPAAPTSAEFIAILHGYLARHEGTGGFIHECSTGKPAALRNSNDSRLLSNKG